MSFKIQGPVPFSKGKQIYFNRVCAESDELISWLDKQFVRTDSYEHIFGPVHDGAFDSSEYPVWDLGNNKMLYQDEGGIIIGEICNNKLKILSEMLFPVKVGFLLRMKLLFREAGLEMEIINYK